MTHKCLKCGAEVLETAKYCPECGTALKTPENLKTQAESKTAPKQKPSGLYGYNLIYLVALISLIIVGIYGYRFFVPKETPGPHAQVNDQLPVQQPPVLDQKIFTQLKAKLDANPDGFKENVDMGNFLFDNQRFDEALAYYQKALEVNPNDPDVIVDAGVCYFNVQRLDEAKSYFNKALQINANHPNALYNLGVVSAQLGEMSQMLEAWEKLIEVAPESGPAQTAKRMIDQVRKSRSGN